jgi:hypothetical protein
MSSFKKRFASLRKKAELTPEEIQAFKDIAKEYEDMSRKMILDTWDDNAYNEIAEFYKSEGYENTAEGMRAYFESHVERLRNHDMKL